MVELILASKSKVRKEILDKNKIFSQVKPSNVDEDSVKNSLLKNKITPEIISKNLAELKANKISNKKFIDGSNNRTFLIQKDISFMNEYAPDRTSAGAATPKYYAMWDQDTHYLAPTPNAALTVEIAYTYKPAGLTSTNTSTWLSQNAPNVLLYGCILEALGYLKGPADMIQYYDKMYNQSVQALATYEMGRDRRDEFRDGVIRIPLESRNP